MTAEAWPDLSGTIEVELGPTDLRADATVVLATQSLASRKVRGHMLIPNELLADTAIPVGSVLQASLDRVFRPWRYPDPNPFPIIDLFPRFTRLGRWLRRRMP